MVKKSVYGTKVSVKIRSTSQEGVHPEKSLNEISFFFFSVRVLLMRSFDGGLRWNVLSKCFKQRRRLTTHLNNLIDNSFSHRLITGRDGVLFFPFFKKKDFKV